MASSLSNTIFKLCTPALVYLVVSVLVLIYLVFSGMSALTLIMKSALIVLWTFLLNWLCSRGFGVLSWIIVLLPVIMVVLLASWSVDVGAVAASPSMTATSLGNAAKVGGCSSCQSKMIQEGLSDNATSDNATSDNATSDNATSNDVKKDVKKVEGLSACQSKMT